MNHNIHLSLMWQIIEIGLMAGVDLATNPNLVVLLEEDETLADLERLGPEAILLRWVNYHLARDPKYEAGPITNFKKDIRGECFSKFSVDLKTPTPYKPDFSRFRCIYTSVGSNSTRRSLSTNFQ